MDIPAPSLKRDLLLLAAAIALFFAIGLGARPYLTPSEARYIAIPQQMLLTGDWLTPHINGVPYFEKPPLFYWLQAACMGLFGMGETAGRLVTLLMATANCLLAYAVGRMLYGRRVGLISSLVLASCLMGYGLSRIAMLDMPVSLFLGACLSCFLAAIHTGQRRYFLLMYVAAALAVMSKGLIGIVIPGLVIGTWIVATKRWRVLREAQLLPGLLIFLAITAPWHVLMAQRHPDFLQFYFIHEHVTRFVSDSHKRVEPWWFFTVVTLAGLLPWVAFLPQAVNYLKLWRLRATSPNALFLLLWIVLPLVFFSTSHSKLAPYIFPIFLPLAIVLGHYLAELWQNRMSIHALQLPTQIIASALMLAITAYYMIPVNAHGKLASLPYIPLPMLLPLIAALLGLLYVSFYQPTARYILGGFALLAVTLDLSVNFIAGSVDHSSVKPLVAQAQAINAHAPIVAYGTYFQDLPVYAGYNVTVAGWKGELEFGIDHYPQTHAWMISTDNFWNDCIRRNYSQPGRDMFVLIKRSTYQALTIPNDCALFPIGSHGDIMLLERHPQ
jgi:4-amino-4-deoxy-L-arabinose transferase-like glycosyltransferase